MNEERNALAQELRQIILADRMACDVIDEARDIAAAIGKDAQRQKATILADAEKARAETERQVLEEQEKELACLVAETEEQCAKSQRQMEEKMEQNRDVWLCEIVQKITAF